MRETLSVCAEAVQAGGGTIYLHDPATKTLRFTHVIPSEVAQRIGRLDIADNYGVAGSVFQSGKAQLDLFDVVPEEKDSPLADRTGVTVRSMLTVPIQVEELPAIGVLQLVNKAGGDSFTDHDRTLAATIASIAAMAVHNNRLLQDRERVASLEGMGRTAHDMANKAGALLTFMPDVERNLASLRDTLKKRSVQGEPMFYVEMLEGTFNEVIFPYTSRVYRYARLINDLAAGKELKPKKQVQSMGSVIREAARFLEPEARSKHVHLQIDVQENAPMYEFDDLFLIRIVENLVGNAIKAVNEQITASWLAENAGKEGAYFGTVRVLYSFIDGRHVLQVIDDGAGMSPAAVKALLAGRAKTNWSTSGGSGIGTKVVMELAKAHDAKIRINSRLDQGTTFTLDFPTHTVAARTD